jgi:heptaprenylglyceryl phosphate synthase
MRPNPFFRTSMPSAERSQATEAKLFLEYLIFKYYQKLVSRRFDIMLFLSVFNNDCTCFLDVFFGEI